MSTTIVQSGIAAAVVLGAVFGAALGYRRQFKLLVFHLAAVLTVVVWAWLGAGRTLHPDYALAPAGGDLRLFLALTGGSYVLPVLGLAAMVGAWVSFIRAGSHGPRPTSGKIGNDE
ncbi:hypothetical protein G5B31_04525 [Rhodobacter sp. SGA-6-6]|uniref:hypothetical protein n=1 Tax=Rhodobacter sp. SGA-6-6 TaxID=2710882 RepID=UPI0013EBB679|nr:hypothetical protein [Rhodobacter sp. SGA-6-6]NGM44794.1 hypothetical protein [Rhodobacter sp. SGA-6-6]